MMFASEPRVQGESDIVADRSTARPATPDPPVPAPRPMRLLLVGALLLGSGALLACSGFDRGHVQNWLDQAGPWVPVAFLFGGIASMSLLVPKTVVSVAAGALFGTTLGCLLMLIIAVAAAALNYAIGRRWLHASLSHASATGVPQTAAMWLQTPAMWLRAVQGVAAEAGFRFHFLVRLTPIPTTLISYAMGASGSRVRPFLLAAAVAVIPQSLWVHGGTAATLAGDSVHRDGDGQP